MYQSRGSLSLRECGSSYSAASRVCHGLYVLGLLPILSQSLCSYKVDRQASIQVLQRFLSEKEDKLDAEVKWLRSEQIDCVLSDAAFLAW